MWCLIAFVYLVIYLPLFGYFYYHSRPLKLSKNLLFFGLKWKFAIFLIPMPFAQFAVLAFLQILIWIGYIPD